MRSFFRETSKTNPIVKILSATASPLGYDGLMFRAKVLFRTSRNTLIFPCTSVQSKSTRDILKSSSLPFISILKTSINATDILRNTLIAVRSPSTRKTLLVSLVADVP